MDVGILFALELDWEVVVEYKTVRISASVSLWPASLPSKLHNIGLNVVRVVLL